MTTGNCCSTSQALTWLALNLDRLGGGFGSSCSVCAVGCFRLAIENDLLFELQACVPLILAVAIPFVFILVLAGKYSE